MTDKTREAPPRLTTVLDPLRPAVVVRRRVVDAPKVEQGSAQRTFSTATHPPPNSSSLDDDDDDDGDEDDDMDNGPPSSVNVARALASLRADELQRVEELLRADDEDERLAAIASSPSSQEPAAPPVPEVPTLLIGKEITLAELARRMNMASHELVTTLVSRGFYSMTAKTVLPRKTARVIAEPFGWHVEDAPESEDPATDSSPANSAVRSKKKAAAKVKAPPSKKRTAR